MESIDKNDAEIVSKKNHIDISDKEKILATLSQLAMGIEISGNPIKAEVCLWQYINDLLYSAEESSIICLDDEDIEFVDGIPFHDGKSPVCIDRDDYDECEGTELFMALRTFCSDYGDYGLDVYKIAVICGMRYIYDEYDKDDDEVIASYFWD